MQVIATFAFVGMANDLPAVVRHGEHVALDRL